MDLTELLKTLRYDFNALAEAEERTGQNLLAAIASWPGLSALQARALLFALLLPAHPKVTVAEAGGLLTQDMTSVFRAIRVTLVAADLLEEEKKEGAGDGKDKQDNSPELGGAVEGA